MLSGAKTELVKEFQKGDVSSVTLRRYFRRILDNPPTVKPLTTPKKIYLKVDGKHFGRWGCLLVYKEGQNLIYWNFVERENSFNYLLDLVKLKELGYEVVGVTSDWHGGIVSAVNQVFKGNVPHQRCLVHTQRSCESFLTKNPQTEAGVRLLDIVKYLNQIRNHYEARLWLNRLSFWERDFGEIVKERTYGVKEDGCKTWWYTHKNLRRAYRSLKKSVDHLFLYLDYEGLEKDTNGLEAEFSHLKQKLGMHRGLTRKRQIGACYWYCHLKSL